MDTLSAVNERASEVSAKAPAKQEAGCCGGPAPKASDACCALDDDIKTAGGAGCGCTTTAPAKRSSCC